jgi:alpha-ketoglutarate-dependent taurine dioxygenase
MTFDAAAGLADRIVPPGIPADAWPVDPPAFGNRDLQVGLESLERTVQQRGCAIAVLPAELDDQTLTVSAWNLVAAVWKPVPQYDTGELVYPVEVRSGESASSHYSASRATGGFHTDGSLLARPPAVGVLMCLSPADSGGETVLIDAELVQQALADVDPTFVELLSQPQPFAAEDDADGVRQWSPVLSMQEGQVALRYLRRYLVAGWQRAGRPAPDRFDEALDVIDAVAADPAAQRSHPLQRGELLVWRNCRYLHGRRPFEEQQRSRRLVRIYGADDPARLAAGAGA